MIMDVVSTTVMTMNLEEIKSYLLMLKGLGIDLDILLQVKDDNELKILVNDSMKDRIKEVYNGIGVEVFEYGT